MINQKKKLKGREMQYQALKVVHQAKNIKPKNKNFKKKQDSIKKICIIILNKIKIKSKFKISFNELKLDLIIMELN